MTTEESKIECVEFLRRIEIQILPQSLRSVIFGCNILSKIVTFCDKLLSTILPPSLVSRVQEGEKNISFSV